MIIIFASQNNHKLQEIKGFLPNFTLLSLNDLHDVDEVLEDGETFSENAFKKAHYFFQKYQLPVFADDSGLVVEALNGNPGVKSARYAGEDVNYLENNLLLLKEMTLKTNRKAFFITVICFIDELGNAHYFEAKWEGEISTKLTGEHGFGYDPLFYVPELNKTVAELTMEEKNKISHRALAFKQFSEYLKNHY
ncbi:MAG: RdgB/HAM1 family non-canonical purine NTP pyrophosphatase [Bacilli bacterium]